MASSHPQGNPRDAWRDFINSYYPNALTKAYCVPHLHLNRVPYRKVTITDTGINALVVQDPSEIQQVKGKRGKSKDAPSNSPAQSPAQVAFISVSPEASPVRVQESDFLDDFGQNHVVTNLEALGEKLKEPMFILSQVSFRDYLQQPTYAIETAHLPHPADLNVGRVKYSDGEADILVLHRRYGVLIGELKSVGRHQFVKKTTLLDTSVADKIQKAVDQLTKSKKVIKHLVSDIARSLTVKNALFLPFVSRKQVRKVLTSQPDLLEAVCNCLEAADVTEAVELCVCAEQLPDTGVCRDEAKDVLAELSTWWRHRMDTDDPLLCGPGGDELYLDIAARFVGPATTVEVHCPVHPRLCIEMRTAGQAVAELGHRLSRLVLTPQQLDLLNKDQPFVYLHGPPGTGKTVLLVLQALRRLRQGHDVHIISTRFFTLPSSCAIKNHLCQTIAATAQEFSEVGTVYLHDCEFSEEACDVNEPFATLSKDYHEGTLCVIMDEVALGPSNTAAAPTKKLILDLHSLQAKCKVKQLYIWCAGAGESNIPNFLKKHEIAVPLRSVPVVVQEVTPVLGTFHISPYVDIALPSPGQGPAPITLHHSGEGHTEKEPVDCEACGRDVAATLRDLGVGSAESSALSWRDVFVLTRRSVLYDDEVDLHGNAQPPCSFVQGLRSAGIPVTILRYKDQSKRLWAEQVADVATARSDRVTVAPFTCVRGLERRVVVWLQASWSRERENYSQRDKNDQDKLFIISRSTTQLVIVKESQPGEDTEKDTEKGIWVNFSQTDVVQEDIPKQTK